MIPKNNLLRLIEEAQATTFQKKVWKALLTIPAGEVRTYSWLAERIRCPKAVRAVGGAVAKNPFAPDVPCHRIVRKDGSLGGYSGPGGMKTKKRLLKKENAL